MVDAARLIEEAKEVGDIDEVVKVEVVCVDEPITVALLASEDDAGDKEVAMLWDAEALYDSPDSTGVGTVEALEAAELAFVDADVSGLCDVRIDDRSNIVDDTMLEAFK